MEDAAIGLLTGGSGGVASMIWSFFQSKKNGEEIDALEVRVDKIAVALAAFQLHVAENYAGKSDVLALGDRLGAQLQRIENKLDGKVDKP